MTFTQRHYLDAIRTDGWARLPSAVAPDTVQRLRQEIETVVRSADLKHHCLYFHEQGQLDHKPILVRVERVWESLSSLDDALGPALYEIAESCLGERVCLFKDKVNIRWPSSPGYGAHQDIAAGWLDYAGKFVSIAVFLDPSDRVAGGFEIATGRHREGLFANVRGEIDKAEFESFDPRLIEFGEGDLLLLDGQTPHRTLANMSGKNVMHFIVTFSPQSSGSQRNRYYEAKVQNFRLNASSINEFVFREFLRDRR